MLTTLSGWNCHRNLSLFLHAYALILILFLYLIIYILFDKRVYRVLFDLYYLSEIAKLYLHALFLLIELVYFVLEGT